MEHEQFGVGAVNYPPYPAHMQGAPPPHPAISPAPQPAPVVHVVAPPLPVSVPTLQAGHRYQILQLAPIPGAAPLTADQGQALLDMLLPGTLHVVSITPASGAHPTALIVDALHGSPIVLPPTMPLTDLGPTPVAPPPPAPEPPPTPTPAPTPAPTDAHAFVFTPNAFPQAVSAAPGTPVVFSLPPGGSWQSLSFNLLGSMPGATEPLVLPGTSAPVTIAAPPGPATVAATWTDAHGSIQPGAAIFVPAGATLATPIVDPAAVTAVQTMLNAAALVAPGGGGPALLPVPVNGVAADPALAAQLATFQQWLVSIAANPPGGAVAPSVANVPTNGVLDYATLAALSLPL